MTSPSKDRAEAHRHNAKLVAFAAAGQVHDNTDARAVETLVTALATDALANAHADGFAEGMKRAAENLDQIANAMWERTESVRDANDNEVTKEEAEDATTAHCFQRAAQMVREEMGA